MAMIYAQMALARSASRFPPLGPDQLPPATVFTNTPAQAFAKLPFPVLAPERELRTDVPVHDTNPMLERITCAWERFMAAFDLDVNAPANEMYAKALSVVSGVNCPAKDLEAFMEVLSTFQNVRNFKDMAGFFIAALINTGPDQRYVVRTEHLDVRVDRLGAYNEKEILVDGDAGEAAGLFMKGGRLTITGDAGGFLGHSMEDGILTVFGDAMSEQKSGLMAFESDVGALMTGGEIQVCGRGQKSLVVGGGKIFIGGIPVYPPLIPRVF